MKVPENCPIKDLASVPVSCPCYNRLDCSVYKKKSQQQLVGKPDCVSCPEGKVHGTGSILYVICKHQTGVRQINDKCNYPKKKALSSE